MAPKLFGGVAGKTPVEGIELNCRSSSSGTKYTDICQIGEDIRIKTCDKNRAKPVYKNRRREKLSPLYTADRNQGSWR